MEHAVREPDDYEALAAAAHGPPATDEQRAAVAGWESLPAGEYAPRPTLRVPAHPLTRCQREHRDQGLRLPQPPLSGVDGDPVTVHGQRPEELDTQSRSGTCHA